MTDDSPANRTETGLAGRFDPTAIERQAQRRWQSTADDTTATDGYTIDSPPPTVSGELHIGHLYMTVIQDIVARYRSLRDGDVYFPLGFDDNGIASERFTERVREIDRSEYDRSTFEAITRTVCTEYERQFTEQLETFGLSISTAEPYHTNGPAFRGLSQASFLELYENDRIYRKRAPTLWCPECETAIAQAETAQAERTAQFYDVEFALDDRSTVTVATTRPELLPACVGLFLHPEDPRADDLDGQTATVPLFDEVVPVRTDERVDRETGTGIVMCCTFGDQTDVEWYRAYDLPVRQAIDETGTTTALTGAYAGLSVEDARNAIVDAGTKTGVIAERSQTTQTVGRHERCSTPIEFQLTTQWYCRLLDRADEYLDAARTMDWYPESLFTRFEHWVSGLEWDWCLSRQRDVGVALPVWYCTACRTPVLAEPGSLPVDPSTESPPCDQCPDCGQTDFTPETDVFDTWATSALTPLYHADWGYDAGTDSYQLAIPERYPADIRVQGHDIISTWLFYTIVKCVEHTGEPPFEQVLLHGMVLDEQREAMSKSKGNTIAPDELTQTYSMDAIRYWTAGTAVGEDFAFREAELEAGTRLCRKLWNGSKLIESSTPTDPATPDTLSPLDRWILRELDATIATVTDAFESFEFGRARTTLRTFFWNTVCDDYLEITKQYRTDSTPYTLRLVHRRLLELFSPLLPHLTDELYQQCYESSVFDQEWPTRLGIEADRSSGDTAMAVLHALREYKSERQLALTAELDTVAVYGPIDGFETAIAKTMNVTSLERLEEPPATSAQIVDIDLEYSAVGPKYGERVRDIEAAIAAGEYSLTDGTLAVAGESLDSTLFDPVVERDYEIDGVVRERDDAIIIVQNAG